MIFSSMALYYRDTYIDSQISLVFTIEGLCNGKRQKRKSVEKRIGE